jgi:hypothetical protein
MTTRDIPTHFDQLIAHLTARIVDYRDRRVRLTESDTIRVLVLPALQALGWDLQDVEEVRSEYRHASADNLVDYALFLHGSPVFCFNRKFAILDASIINHDPQRKKRKYDIRPEVHFHGRKASDQRKICRADCREQLYFEIFFAKVRHMIDIILHDVISNMKKSLRNKSIQKILVYT